MTTDDMDIFERWWRPQSEPKAVVIIVHGYAEHSGRYDGVAEHLKLHGYSVYAFDLRGHGRSKGQRGLIRSFDEYLTDLGNAVSHVREREPKRPIFLFGHSLGGTIAILFAITRKPDVAGMILSGPYLKIDKEVSPLLLKLVLLISRAFPKLPVAKRVNSQFVSRDPKVVEGYRGDPLIYRGRIKAQTAAEIIRAVKEIKRNEEAIRLPLLILQGTDDHLADVEDSKEVYARANSPDKTIKLYKGLYHEVLNEPEKAKVLADLVAWLDAHAVA